MLLFFKLHLFYHVTHTPTLCSRLLYSPSVLSLMITMSMFLWRVLTLGSDWQRITLVYRSKVVLERERERARAPDPISLLSSFNTGERWKMAVLPEQVVPGNCSLSADCGWSLCYLQTQLHLKKRLIMQNVQSFSDKSEVTLIAWEMLKRSQSSLFYSELVVNKH